MPFFVTLVEKLVIPQLLILLALQLALHSLRHLLDVMRTRKRLDLCLMKVEASNYSLSCQVPLPLSVELEVDVALDPSRSLHFI